MYPCTRRLLRLDSAAPTAALRVSSNVAERGRQPEKSFSKSQTTACAAAGARTDNNTVCHRILPIINLLMVPVHRRDSPDLLKAVLLW